MYTFVYLNMQQAIVLHSNRIMTKTKSTSSKVRSMQFSSLCIVYLYVSTRWAVFHPHLNDWQRAIPASSYMENCMGVSSSHRLFRVYRNESEGVVYRISVHNIQSIQQWQAICTYRPKTFHSIWTVNKGREISHFPFVVVDNSNSGLFAHLSHIMPPSLSVNQINRNQNHGVIKVGLGTIASKSSHFSRTHTSMVSHHLKFVFRAL